MAEKLVCFGIDFSGRFSSTMERIQRRVSFSAFYFARVGPRIRTIKSIRGGDQIASLWCPTVVIRIKALSFNELHEESGHPQGDLPGT